MAFDIYSSGGILHVEVYVFAKGCRVIIGTYSSTNNNWEELRIRRSLIGERGTITKVCSNDVYEVKLDRYSKKICWFGYSLIPIIGAEKQYDLPMIG